MDFLVYLLGLQNNQTLKIFQSPDSSWWHVSSHHPGLKLKKNTQWRDGCLMAENENYMRHKPQKRFKAFENTTQKAHTTMGIRTVRSRIICMSIGNLNSSRHKLRLHFSVFPLRLRSPPLSMPLIWAWRGISSHFCHSFFSITE